LTAFGSCITHGGVTVPVRDRINAPIPADAAVAWLTRIRAGDSAAFEALYVAHYDRLWRFAYRHVGSTEAAEDVVHDVFAALWNQRAAVMVHTSVTAYLLGAVHKRAIDVTRRRQVAERIAAAGDAVAMGVPPRRPDAWAEEVAARAAIARVVASLPPRQRLAIALRWREQLRYVEIAAVLGVSEAAVRKLVDKAHVTLRRALDGWRRDEGSRGSVSAGADASRGGALRRVGPAHDRER
jgi:RNA polymerase sigma factor (sigma-70 family)